MGELQQKDVQECLVSVKQIKKIVVHSSDLASMTENVFSLLFGEVVR